MKRNHSATLLRTPVRHELLDRREVVVPEVKGVTGVLLLVQGDGERNGLLDHI